MHAVGVKKESDGTSAWLQTHNNAIDQLNAVSYRRTCVRASANSTAGTAPQCTRISKCVRVIRHHEHCMSFSPPTHDGVCLHPFS